MKKEIKIIWSIYDILKVDNTLTEGESSEILEILEKNHDANIGINWDVIMSTINIYKDKKKEHEVIEVKNIGTVSKLHRDYYKEINGDRFFVCCIDFRDQVSWHTTSCFGGEPETFIDEDSTIFKFVK